MFKLTKFFLAGTLVVASQSLIAGTYSNGKKIEKMTMSSSGNLYIRTAGAEIDPANCSSGSANAYGLSGSNPQYKNIYAMLLSAAVSGGTIDFYISDTACVAGNPKLERVRGNY